MFKNVKQRNERRGIAKKEFIIKLLFFDRMNFVLNLNLFSACTGKK